MDASAATAVRAGRREFIGLAVLMLPTILVALDRSVLYLSLPHVGEDLHASSVQQLWITDIHDFMIAGLLVTMGTLGDRIGRKRLLFLGVSAFAIADLIAAYSSSAGMLIATRALVGIAGSTIMPSTMALISAMFRNRRQHTTAIAVWMGCFTVGQAIGPVLGGALIERFWWGAAFLVGVPVMVVTLLLGRRLLPEHRNAEAARVDVPSVLLSLLAILPFVYGLKQLSRDGVGTVPILAIVVGLVAGVLFVLRQLRLTHPLLDVGLFRRRAFSAALVLTLCTGVMSGTYLFVYLYLQTVAGLSPMATALWLLPPTLTVVLVIQLVPPLVRRVKPAYAIAVGLVIQVIGWLMFVLVGSDGRFGMLIAGMVVISIGLGPLAGLGATLTLQSAPPDKAGSAAALTETAGEFGIAMGIATIGVYGAALYRDNVRLDPGLPGPVEAAAHDSIIGALTSAASLPADVATRLLHSAYEGLTASLHGTAVASAVVAAVAAVLAVATLRHVPPSDRPFTEDIAAAAGEPVRKPVRQGDPVG